MTEHEQPIKKELFGKKNPIKFQYQRGDRFQRLVDEGFAKTLEESNFCGLACMDMAISAYIPDDDKRMSLTIEIGENAKALGLIKEDGTMGNDDDNKNETYFSKVNSIFQREGIPYLLEATPVKSQNDVCDQLENGNLVQLIIAASSADDPEGHALLADSAFSDIARQERLFRWWDPSISNEDFARNYSSSLDPFFKLPNFTGTHVSPEIFVFKRRK